MSPVISNGSGAVKNSLVKKSTQAEKGVQAKKSAQAKGAREAKESASKGMMITFVHEDLETKTYVTKDPVFDGVVGFQRDFRFLTGAMVDRMKSEVGRADPDVDLTLYSFPINEDLALDLAYNYSSCMKKCRGGETCSSTVVAHADF